MPADPAGLSLLSALARESLEESGTFKGLEKAERHFRARVREQARLTMAAADEGAAAVFGAVLTEALERHLAKRPRR